ncbi:MAG: DUF6178 family protein [Myxococcota bacterium]
MTDSTVVQLSRFRADLARTLNRRARALLDTPDIKQQTEALEPLEAYFLIKEIGVADAALILRHATHVQLQAFVDIDCWVRDRPDPIEIDAWLAPFAAEGPSTLARAFAHLDEEVQTLFLASSIIIHDASEDGVPDPVKDVARMTTPDRYFVLDAVDADMRDVHPFVLVEALYASDVQVGFTSIMAAKWELKSQLEETALHFRNGRMEELGFPSRQDALAIFAPPPSGPPKPIARGNPIPATLPALYAQPLTETSLLGRGLARIADQRLLEAIESDLAYLISAAIVAYGETPRDISHVTEFAARVRDTVSLGLEALASPDGPLRFPDGEQAASDAAATLDQWPMRLLFRHGHYQVTMVQKGAAALATDPIVAHWLQKTETEHDDYGQDRLDREFLRALLDDRPLHGGFDTLKPERRVAYATKQELVDAEERLDAIAKRLL